MAMARWRLALIIGFLSFGTLGVARADMITGYVPLSTVARVAARLKKTLHDGGMVAVSADVQKCYDDVKNDNLRAISECMLYDIAAYRLDGGMRVPSQPAEWMFRLTLRN
jgi:hypothetical protein